MYAAIKKKISRETIVANRTLLLEFMLVANRRRSCHMMLVASFEWHEPIGDSHVT